MKEIKEIEEEMKITSHDIQELMRKNNKLEAKRISLMLENDMLIKDLSEYEGKDITFIDAYDKDGKDVYIPTDEIVDVRNGRLYCSSYSGGILSWSEKEQCYIYSYHMREERLEIEGFLDIIVDED